MDTFRQLSDALRMIRRARNLKHDGFRRWAGSPWQICSSIVEANWNGRFYTTSTGHFNQFYSRDFGMCAESLIRLGHKKRVSETIHYALGTFHMESRITTHISPNGKALDFPSYTPESLAYILRAVRLSKDKDLLHYSKFLEKEAAKAFKTSINPDTGLIKSDKNFSTMKDHAKRKSSCYLNSMIGMISSDLNTLKLKNPFKQYNYEKIIKENFWNGSYFQDDLSGKKHVAGDANVFPFWTGLFSDKAMFEKSLNAMKEAKLDYPLPLKYTKKQIKKGYLFWPKLIMPNYEGNTIWFHLGACFLEVIAKHKKSELKKYLKSFENIIQNYHTFPEVLNPNGSPYRLPWYHCDEGMLWSAIPLRLHDGY